MIQTRAATALKLTKRRTAAREQALAKADATLKDKDAALQKAKEHAKMKLQQLQNAQDGKLVDQGNAVNAVPMRGALAPAATVLKIANEARVANEAIEDCANALMGAIEKRDIAYRASKIAAEACLLSASGSAAKLLKSLARNERQNLTKRLKALEDFELAVDDIDIRSDLSWYIEKQVQLT